MGLRLLNEILQVKYWTPFESSREQNWAKKVISWSNYTVQLVCKRLTEEYEKYGIISDKPAIDYSVTFQRDNASVLHNDS